MRVLIVALSLSIAAPGASAGAACQRYDAESVSLSGTVKLQTFFGPPNFGENPDTDSRSTQAILHLDRPLCVQESDDDVGETNQRRITLVPGEKMRLKGLAGKRVRVSGSLFHGFNGHHNTPLLLQLDAMPVALGEGRR